MTVVGDHRQSRTFRTADGSGRKPRPIRVIGLIGKMDTMSERLDPRDRAAEARPAGRAHRLGQAGRTRRTVRAGRDGRARHAERARRTIRDGRDGRAAQAGRAGRSRRAGRTSRPGATTRTRVTEVTPGAVRERRDDLATEEPLEIRAAGPGAAGRPWRSPCARPATTSSWRRLPASPKAWSRPAASTGSRYCTARTSRPRRLQHRDGAAARAARPARARQRTSSPRQRLRRLRQGQHRRPARCASAPVAPRACASPPGTSYGLPERLRDRAAAFERTGGLHAAGLFTAGRRAPRAPRGRGPAQRRRQAGRLGPARRTLPLAGHC